MTDKDQERALRRFARSIKSPLAEPCPAGGNHLEGDEHVEHGDSEYCGRCKRVLMRERWLHMSSFEIVIEFARNLCAGRDALCAKGEVAKLR